MKLQEKQLNRIALLFFVVLIISSSTLTNFPDVFAQFPSFDFSNQTNPAIQTDPNVIHTELQNAYNDFNPVTHTGIFTQHPDFLLDYTNSKGTPVYVPYKIFSGTNYLTFESDHNSATFYTDSCTAKIFDGGKVSATENALVQSVSFDLQTAKNGSDNWIESPINSQTCNISHTENGNVITFDLVQTLPGSATKDIRFIFDLAEKPEAILRVTNDNQTDTQTKYGFAVSLTGLPKVNIADNTFIPANTTLTQINQFNNSNDVISIQGSTTTLKVDPQNNLNHYLWATKIENNQSSLNLILDYKNSPGSLLPGQTLEIDPTFTSGAGVSYSVDSTNTSGTDCTTYSTTDGSSRTTTPANGATGGSNYCVYNVLKFSISGFSKQWTATQVNYQYSINFNSGGDKACTYTQELNDPAVTAGSTLFNDVRTGTTYLTGDNNCKTVGGPYSVNLGSTAKTDFNSNVQAGKTWFAIGGRFDSMLKSDAHLDEADFITNSIVVTYSWNPPAPITDLGCNDNAINSIACNWSVPTSTDPIIGYYLTQNKTLNAPLYTNHLIRYYKLDYLDPNYNIVDSANGYNATVTSGSFIAVSGMIAQSMNFTNTSTTYLTASGTGLPTGTSDRTISFWYQPTAYPSSLISMIVMYGAASNSNVFGIALQNTGKIYLAGYANDVTGNTALGINDWTHVTVTLSNGGTTRQLYLNGTLDKTATTTALNTTPSSLYIGYDVPENTWQLTKGKVDDLRIYDKTLSPSDIAKVSNYRMITTNNYLDTTPIYPFSYNYNVAAVSDKGQIAQILGNTVQIAPYNVIDPPYQVKATLGSDTNGFFENVTWSKPKVANSICGSLCSPNGYQVQHYNTTTHSYQTDSTNQTALSYKLYKLNQNTTQNIRLFTNNHAGLSARTFPLNQTTYPQEISHWMLQNNLIDTRNTNNATLTGNWNFTTGRNGNAQYFDGNTMDSGNDNNFPNGNSPRSISFWVKWNNQFTQYASLIYYGNQAVNQAIAIYPLQSGTTSQLGFDPYGGNVLTTITSFNLNQWYNVVYTYDGSTLKVYVNGVLDNFANPPAFNTVLNHFQFGKRIDASSYHNGYLSDIRLFNAALTQQQITNQYNEAIASRQNVNGVITNTHSVIGNVGKITPTITMSGFPQTFTLTKTKVINNTSTVLQSHTLSLPFTVSITDSPFWQNVTASTSNLKTNATVYYLPTSNINITSSSSAIVQQYNPTMTPAPNGNPGTLNYTWQRVNSNSGVDLKVNRQPMTWPIECFTQEGLYSKHWHNYTNLGTYEETYPVAPYNALYVTCYNDHELLNFTSQSGNQTGLGGLQIIDSILGGNILFGLPAWYIFILIVPVIFTSKNADTGIIFTVAAVGIMAALGLITTLNDGLWSLIFALAGFGIFMGKKIFF